MAETAQSQFVTRDEFVEFLEDPNGDLEGPLFDLLRSVPEAHRQPLFEVGNSVCEIKNPGKRGSGFHLGAGWIMTALHVVSKDGAMRAEYVSESSFHFPNQPPIEAKSRPCIFSNFRGACAKDPLKDTVKDIALIYVSVLDPSQPADEHITIKGLVNPHQEPPQAGDHVYLVHFGDIDETVEGEVPQQFSVNNNVVPKQRRKHRSRNRYCKHNTHCPPGSSGAPLLVWREDKFLLGGVLFAGSAKDGLSTGYALWFTHENWLQKTVSVTSLIVTRIRDCPDSPEHDFTEQYLKST